MGLDMYAYASPEKVDALTDFEVEDCRLFHTWRKHPDLHGWMEELYVSKGGNELFNCAAVILTAHDLDSLEKEIRNARLPETSGFFFGESDGDETEDDLAFIAKARKEIQNQMTVFYSAWW